MSESSKPASKTDKNSRPPGQMAISSMFKPIGGSSPPAASKQANSSSASNSSNSLDHTALRAKLVNRTDQSQPQFEIKLSSHDHAYLQYAYVKPNHGSSSKDEMILDLQHTVVPKSYQGQGIAGILVQHAFEFAKAQDIKVRPTCTYIHDFVKKRPEWAKYLEPKPGKQNDTSNNKIHQKHQTPPANNTTRAPPASASSSAHSSTLQPPRQRENDPHSGDKRRSPSAEAEPREDWRSKMAKREDGPPAASSTAAAASSSNAPAPAAKPGAIPTGHVPLPFSSPVFAKKWPNALAALTQAQEIAKEFREKISLSPSSPSSDSISEAIDETVDLMRSLAMNKANLDVRAIGMKYFLDVYVSQEQRMLYLQHTIPFLLDLIRQLPTYFDTSRPENSNLKASPTGWLPILRPQHEGSLTLTKIQIVALLACSFFGMHAEHVAQSRGFGAPEKRFHSANFDGLWLNIGRTVKHALGTNDTPEEIRSENHTEVEKLKCIMLYFECMRTRVQGAANKSNPNSQAYAKILQGGVTFHRKCVKLTASEIENRMTNSSSTSASTIVSTSTDLRSVGTIEDDGYGTLQIDFANAFLGGGVLTGGCIQEEIRLTINTECLIGLLFVEKMEVNESVTIIGAERFANYTGYSSSFQCAGVHEDATPVDPILNRMKTVIVAIDAIAFRRKAAQYEKASILREILKAYAGFALEDSVLGVRGGLSPKNEPSVNVPDSPLLLSYVLPSIGAASSSAPVGRFFQAGVSDQDYTFHIISTGNWGCGAFGAEVPLKTLIQLLAATLAHRSLRYFTFAADVCEPLPELLRVLSEQKPTVRQLYEACLSYHPDRSRGRSPAEYIRDLLDGSDAKKQAEYLAQRDRARDEARQRQQAAHDAAGRPAMSRNIATGPIVPSASARHTNAASSSAADSSFDFDLDSDPITDFPSDGEEGYNSEDARALAEAEMED